jgi:hypothetical protein
MHIIIYTYMYIQLDITIVSALLVQKYVQYIANIILVYTIYTHLIN